MEDLDKIDILCMVLFHHMLVFSIECFKHKTALVARKSIFWYDPMNFGHVSLKPEFVANLLAANIASHLSMHRQRMVT